MRHSPKLAVLQNEGAAVVRPQVVHLLAAANHVWRWLSEGSALPTPTAFWVVPCWVGSAVPAHSRSAVHDDRATTAGQTKALQSSGQFHDLANQQSHPRSCDRQHEALKRAAPTRLLSEELHPELLADELDGVQVAADAGPVPRVPLHQLPPDPEPCGRTTACVLGGAHTVQSVVTCSMGVPDETDLNAAQAGEIAQRSTEQQGVLCVRTCCSRGRQQGSGTLTTPLGCL
jgi:hypothetical protein